MGRGLASSDAGAQNLTLHGRDVSGVHDLCEAVQANKTLETLILSECELVDKCVDDLADMWRTAVTVKNLDVHGNGFSDGGRQFLLTLTTKYRMLRVA